MAGYMMEIENVTRFGIIRSLYLKNEPHSHYSLNMNAQNVMHLGIIRSLYPKNVSRFMHLRSFGWRSVWRIPTASTFFSFLDERKEGKRKSRPLPRPGKMAGYVWGLKNGSRNRTFT